MLAIEGKLDFTKNTSPFGAKKQPSKKQVQSIKTQRAALAFAMAEAKRKAENE